MQQGKAIGRIARVRARVATPFAGRDPAPAMIHPDYRQTATS
jgi:hypothetical protein